MTRTACDIQYTSVAIQPFPVSLLYIQKTQPATPASAPGGRSRFPCVWIGLQMDSHACHLLRLAFQVSGVDLDYSINQNFHPRVSVSQCRPWRRVQHRINHPASQPRIQQFRSSPQPCHSSAGASPWAHTCDMTPPWHVVTFACLC